jgi:transcription elongation GreA/GreB family factor
LKIAEGRVIRLQLDDLFDRDITQLTEDELAEKLHSLKRMRVKTISEKVKKIKTNKDSQLEDLLKNLSQEQIKALITRLENMEDI